MARVFSYSNSTLEHLVGYAWNCRHFANGIAYIRLDAQEDGMKPIKIFILLLLLIGAGGIALFYYRNLRGIGPAVLPPVGNIAQSIGQTKEVPAQNSTGLPLALPNGFSISIFAKDLVDPRVLRFDQNGTLLVSIPGQGKVVALPDKNGDGKADEVITIAHGLNGPHGIALQNSPDIRDLPDLPGTLIIAETDKIDHFDYYASKLKADNKSTIIQLPNGGNHVTRTVGFGPDGKLYISIGSSCNVCVEKDSRRAKILISNADGADLQEYASGLRNSVFFLWHPVTHELWATEMGRDLIGDDIPPDEINIIKQGKFYGWPYCYGKNIHDATFDNSQTSRDLCATAEPSYIDMQAHSAPLGLVFVPANSNWPKDYWYNLLVSYHGSWNRSVPTGYKVVRYKLDQNGKYLGQEDFITGWLASAGALGRPVDEFFDSKGNLFISDDKAGVIYRVTHQ